MIVQINLIWMIFGFCSTFFGSVIGAIIGEIFIEEGRWGLCFGSIIGFGIAITVASYQ